MSDLTAIDILINPDEATIERAHEVNARMRQSVPDGFALDATHQPHITTLQRYVRTADLDHVYEAVEQKIAATDMDSLSYEAVAIRHTDWGVPGQGLAVLVVQPSPEVLDFQASLLAAVTPFVGRTEAAFVTDPGEQISQSTMDWVEGFVPELASSRQWHGHTEAQLRNSIAPRTTSSTPITRVALVAIRRASLLSHSWKPSTALTVQSGAKT